MVDREDTRREKIRALMSICGICGNQLKLNWSHKKGQLCRQCETRAVDSQHRAIEVATGFHKEEFAWYFKGPTAYFAETGEECLEVRTTRICWVDGIACKLTEGRMGNVGLVVKDFPQLRIELSVKEH